MTSTTTPINRIKKNKIPDVFTQAMVYHQSGRLAEAENLYNVILAADSRHVDSLHLLGLITHQKGRFEDAVRLITKAIKLNNKIPAFHTNLGLVLEDQGRLEEAVLCYERALAIQPGYGAALINLGNALRLQGRLDEAIARYEQALVIKPDFPEALSNLGNVFKDQSRFDEAIARYEQALALRPDDAITLTNLGNALRLQGRLDEAIACYERSLALKPDFPEALSNLGNVFKDQGRFDEATARYEQALALKPDYVEALSNLGNVFREQERLDKAIACYERALAIKPDYVEALSNLGNVFRELERLDKAIACYERALALRPDYPEALSNLGNALRDQEQLDKAMGCYRQALVLKPNYAEAHYNLGILLKELWRLHEAASCHHRALVLKPDFAEAQSNLGITLAYLSLYDDVVAQSNAALALSPDNRLIWEQRLYSFSYHPDLSAEEIYAEFVRWGDRFPLPYTDFSSHDRTAGRRLRIGYVSPDFRRHTSRFYFMPLFANHDKAQVELFAYSNVQHEDSVTGEFKGIFDHWRNIRGVSKEDAAAMIQADRIDILVDCCNHMRDDRLDIFTLKPAPVQVTWLGAAWTTGLKMVDYVLFDPYIAPEGTLTRETIVRLPHFFVAYQPPEATAEVTPPPRLKNGYITFGYSGRTERLNHHTFRVWGEILRRLSDAKLILDYHPFADPPTQEHYRTLLTSHGLDISRVIMRKSDNIFYGLNDIDILLDCFPHSGGTMLFDALWMGIPALTLASRPPLGRIGTSLMMNLGLPEWVAQTEEEYIAKAIAFSGQPQYLAELRNTMRQRMRTSPVMDGKGFAQGVENAYRLMWKNWAAELTEICQQHISLQTPPAKDELALLSLFNSGQYHEAEQQARQMIGQYPLHVFGWKALGAILKEIGRLKEALVAMQQSVRLAPDDSEAHNSLGVVYKQMECYAEAEVHYRQAIALTPEYHEAFNNLGNLFLHLKRFDEAEYYYRRAIQMRPDLAAAYNNLGTIYHESKRLAEAFASYQQAIELQPDYVKVYGNMGTALAYLSLYDDVVFHSNKALALSPEDVSIWEQRLYSFSYHPDLSAEEIYAEFVRWGDRFPLPSVDFSSHNRTPGRRLRVGYVSPDFRAHTSRFYFLPLFANHDRQQVELFAYSNVKQEDSATGKFKGIFDHWRNIRGVSKEDAAEMIKADGIDILVDCCNHMLDDRLDIFSLKPAPIQVTWLGAAWTTGLPMVDYVLFDPFIAPEGTLARESIIRLPHFFVAYQPPEKTAEVQQPPCLANGFITFGYSGRTERLNHKTFRVWGQILKRLPDAKLILDYHPFDDLPTQEHYRQLMIRHGVDISRVIMRKSANIFNGLDDIDILLDCFPHSGGTMLFDALWMGVPALTLASRPPLGRIGTSLMMNLGLPEWVAHTEVEYIERAIAFSGQPHLLAELRAGMRQRMQNSPVMDGKGFTKGVEDAYRKMWENWVATNTGQGVAGEQKQGSGQPETDALQNAFNSGNYAEAEQLALAMTRAYPFSATGWKALGVILQRTGRIADSLMPKQRSVELMPDDAEAHNNLGVAFNNLGCFEDAEACYRRAIALKPDYAEAYSNLGNVLKDYGRVDEAEACYRQAIVISPNCAGFHFNLGVVLNEMGRRDEAEEIYRRTITLKSGYAEAHFNLGVVLHETGRYGEAAMSYRQVLVLKPDYIEAYSNLGMVLNELGLHDEAEAFYRKALLLKPDSASMYYNLGIALNDLRRFDEALLSYRQAIKLKPDYAEAHNNLGGVLRELLCFEEAEASYRQAIILKQSLFEAHNNLGNVLKDLGRLNEAELCYRQAIDLNQNFFDAYSNLLFLLNYVVARGQEACLEEARNYGVMVSAKVKERFDAWQCVAQPEKLRVGLISGDLREHPVGYFIEGLLACLALGKIELTAYPTTGRTDGLTARIRPYFSQWKPIIGLSDEAAARMIHADGVHILIDLAGHTAHNRLPVFAWKPAPVQMTWLGYFATTGVAEMDYLIGDPYNTPQEEEWHFTESIWRMPKTCLCFTPPDLDIEVGQLPALSSGHVTFGCFNNLSKLNDKVVALWAKILHAIPNARLFIKAKQLSDKSNHERLLKRFAEHGILTERLHLEKASSRIEYLSAYNRIDIALDPFPFPGGTTSAECLWMGVPVLTRKGDSFLSHQGETIVANAGLADWIAQDDDEYVSKAVQYAADLNSLAFLRLNLRQQVLAYPLFDASQFACSFEAALWGMWEKHCNRSPSNKEIDALQHAFDNASYSEAEQLALSMTKAYPDCALGWKALGVILQHMGRIADARMPMQRSVVLMPDDAEAHNNLGITLKNLGHFEEAEASYHQAIALNPYFAEAHNNLGNMLRELGRLYDAEVSCRNAVTLKSDYAEAHNNLGNALKDLGRFAEAEFNYQRAIALKPGYAEAHSNLGNALKDLGRIFEAETRYRMAITLKPDYAEAYNNLGNVLDDLGCLDEAEVSYHQALIHKPDYANANSNLLFSLNYHPDKSAEEIFTAYREYDVRFGLPHHAKWPQHCNDITPGRRLKVGYVSPDFRQHSCRHFIDPLLAAHDRTEVELFAYAELTKDDAYTKQYKGLVDHWIPTRGMTDDALAERIQADSIDILVDLAGHTTGNRLPVFARKPAPVQVSWLGYGYTTGLTAIDYYLTDAVCAPEGSEHLFSETPWRLSPCGLCYRPAEGMGEVSPLPALEQGYITFGTLTRSVRINYRTIRVWSEILKRLPGSRLVIDSGNFRDAKLCQKLRDDFATHGVSPDRLIIGFHSPPWDVLRGIDISLDCFPHNSGTTLYESLYMGVPFITLADRPSVGRLGASILTGLGHPEWIADSEEAYIEKAVALAGDPGRLAELRTGLRGEMERSSLMDEAGFARKVEQAYREMWRIWVDS